MNEKIAKAIEYIKALDKDSLEVGKHIVDDDFYYLVQEYETRTIDNCKLEAHRKYVDIQWIVRGQEAIQCCSIDGLTEKVEYNPEKDIVFYEQKEDILRVVLTDGSYVVLYPQDAHEPCIAIDNIPSPVKKIVGKVRL